MTLIIYNHKANQKCLLARQVYDGKIDSSYPLLAASSNSTPSTIISASNHMLVVFSSDSSGSFSGFNATYKVYKYTFQLTHFP